MYSQASRIISHLAATCSLTSISEHLDVSGIDFLVEAEAVLLQESIAVLERYLPCLTSAPTSPLETRRIILQRCGDFDARALRDALDMLPSQIVNTYKKECLRYVTVDLGHLTAAVYYRPESIDTFFIRTGQNIHVLLSGASDGVRELMRLCREVATRITESSGAVSLHAACADHPLGGVLLLGPSGSGKTSVLVHLLLSKLGFQFVCNDRALCTNAGDYFAAFGSPLPVRLSAGTLRNCSSLLEFAASKRYERSQQIDYEHLAASELRAVFVGDTEMKFEMAPSELASALRCGRVAKTHLAVIMVPNFNAEVSAVQIRRLGEAETRMKLSCELRTPIDNMWPTPWIEPRSPNFDGWDAAIQGLAMLPAYEVTFGEATSSKECGLAVATILGQ
jgi:hypothetical protein